MTIDHLIHHVSGIRPYGDALGEKGFTGENRVTRQQILEVIGEQKDLPADPGRHHTYSNSNYLLLALIVERASGRSYSEFTRERLFSPLGLAMVARSPGDQVPGRARSYEQVDGRTVESVWRWDDTGAAGIQSTPSEMVRWADNYRTGQVGGAALQRRQLEGAVPAGDGDYAAGLVVRADGALDHDGKVAGFRTAFVVSGDRQHAITVMCNDMGIDPWPLVCDLDHIWFPAGTPAPTAAVRTRGGG